MILAATGIAWAQQCSLDINKISESGVGENVGTVTIAEGNSERFDASEVEHSAHGGVVTHGTAVLVTTFVSHTAQ